MLSQKFDKLDQRMKLMLQSVPQIPIQVEVINYFPSSNSVTVRFLNAPGKPSLYDDAGELHHYPLGYRSDVSAGMAIMPGDLGLIHYTGMQIKKGYVTIVHSSGDANAALYQPIGSAWGI